MDNQPKHIAHVRMQIHGKEVKIPDDILKEYEAHYGTGSFSDIEDVLSELVKESSSNTQRDAVRALEWAVRQAKGCTPPEARKRLEEMMRDGEDYGIE